MHECYLQRTENTSSVVGDKDGAGSRCGRGYVPDRHLPLLVEIVAETEGRLNNASEGMDSGGGKGGDKLEWLDDMFPLANDQDEREQHTCDGVDDGDQSDDQKPRSDCCTVFVASDEQRSTATEIMTSEAVKHSVVVEERPVDNGSSMETSPPDIICPERSGECAAGRSSSLPPPPSAASGSGRCEVGSREDQRPDHRMEGVYESLAERLRMKLRSRTRTSEAGVAGEGVNEQLWLGIAGPPGSGKTTLAVGVII